MFVKISFVINMLITVLNKDFIKYIGIKEHFYFCNILINFFELF